MISDIDEASEKILELVFEFMWYNDSYCVNVMNWRGWIYQDPICIARNEI